MREVATLQKLGDSVSWNTITENSKGKSVEILLTSTRVPYNINIETRKKTVKLYKRSR